jgi:hypothetical protein
MRYLFAINPRNFSVAGNLNTTDSKEQFIDFVWGDNKFGAAKPLHKINTTNGLEGENNAYIHNNICHGTILESVFKFLQQCLHVRTNILEHHAKNPTATVTFISSYFINEEKCHMLNQQVIQTCPSQPVFNVTRNGKSKTVDLEN